MTIQPPKTEINLAKSECSENDSDASSVHFVPIETPTEEVQQSENEEDFCIQINNRSRSKSRSHRTHRKRKKSKHKKNQRKNLSADPRPGRDPDRDLTYITVLVMITNGERLRRRGSQRKSIETAE